VKQSRACTTPRETRTPPETGTPPPEIGPRPHVTPLLPYLGAFIIGLSKAGFAAGLGMLTTPLVAAAMPARTAIGLVLPLLCVADAMSAAIYWRKWDLAAVRSPLAGALLGIVFGMLFVTKVSNRTLTLAIGIVGLLMTLLLIVRARWFPHATYKPRLADSLAIGMACGFSSTIAHAAGPIFALFLLAQRVSKEVFVASNAIFFIVINLLKVPPYTMSGLINQDTLRQGVALLPMIPLGVFAGWAANRMLPQRHFDVIVYVLLLMTSLQLIVSSLG
jgi:uncharacterized membrane protein YfcA